MDVIEMIQAATERVSNISFGDQVTNICAGDNNPTKRSFFVSASRGYVQCTDKKGKFWKTGIEVIFPGHLSDEKCEELFAPIHKILYAGTRP